MPAIESSFQAAHMGAFATKIECREGSEPQSTTAFGSRRPTRIAEPGPCCRVGTSPYWRSADRRRHLLDETSGAERRPRCLNLRDRQAFGSSARGRARATAPGTLASRRALVRLRRAPATAVAFRHVAGHAA